MKRTLGLLIGLLLVTAPVYAQKINIDYAHDYDFEKVETFAYVDTKETNHPNALMDGRIKAAIIAQLIETGLEQAEADVDLYITYHIKTKENTVMSTSGFGYGGVGRGWGGWGGGAAMSTTTVMNYTEGTLIVDAYEPDENKMVWRGTGTVTVKDKPEKQSEQIEKTIAKMGQRWAKILDKMEKKK
jgi:hypothetical protein